VTVETKKYSKQWMHTHSRNKPKFLTNFIARNLTTIVFWEKKGVLMVEFMQQETTITSEMCCETIKMLRAIQNKGVEC
jgi:hypothetical protein